MQFKKDDKLEIKSTAHSRYRCQYHIVFAPKYRRKEIYGQLKKRYRRNHQDIVQAKGCGNNRGRGMCRSYTYAGKYPTVFECSTIYGFSQGEKQPDDI